MARGYYPQRYISHTDANCVYPPQGFFGQSTIPRDGTAIVQTNTLTAIVQTGTLTAIIQTEVE